MIKLRDLYLLLRSYSAFKIATIYFVISFLWIFFSDKLIQFITTDYDTITHYQTLKGWFFITVTTLLLYYLIKREIKKKNTIIHTINESESWYNTLLSNIPKVDVFLFDLKLTFILAQGKQVLNFGLNPDEMRGKSLNNLKLDETIGFMLKENFMRILARENVIKEFIYHDEWYELRGAPVIGEKGDILAGIAIFINITQQKKNINELTKRKNEFEALYIKYLALNEELEQSNKKLTDSNQQLIESEEKYRTFINQTTEGVYRMDLLKPLATDISINEQIKHIYTYTNLVECNQSFARMYGYKNTKDLMGKSVADFHNVENIPENRNIIRNFINAGYRLVNSESLEKDRNGNMKYFSNNTVGIFKNGYMIRMWGTQSDISQRKKYEQELITARKKAEESDRLKSAFLANISHEVRTPLNGIMGFSELLNREDIDSEKIIQYTSVIKRSSQQLLNIINDILDISLLESNELKLSIIEFSLNELMDEIFTFYKFHPQIEEKKLILRCVKPLKNNNDKIIADRNRINQVMLNLINNTVKFTNTGYIEFGYFIQPDNRVKFYVKDSGIGIPPDQQDVVFERFRQLDFNLSRKYGGTGLGLSIARGLVELMGGNIAIRSDGYTGSTFFFSITYQKHKNNGQKAIAEQSIPYFKGYSIVTATEDNDFLKYFDNYSNRFGLTNYHTSNEAKVVEICINNSKINMLLLDTRLTKLNVTEITSKIKKIKPLLPVIYLINNLNEDEKKLYFNTGCDDFINISFDDKIFTELITRFSNLYF